VKKDKLLLVILGKEQSLSVKKTLWKILMIHSKNFWDVFDF